MTYDASLDVVVGAICSIETAPGVRLEFNIIRYDGGSPKLQITRVREHGGEEKRGPLGRLGHREVALLAHQLREILKHRAWGPDALPKGGADGPF